MPKKTTVYFPQTVEEVLAQYRSRGYGEFSRTISEIVLRYHDLMRNSRQSVLDVFTDREREFMTDLTTGAGFSSNAIVGGVQAILLPIDEYVYTVFGVDKDQLMEKLRGLTDAQHYCLVDLLEEIQSSVLARE